MFPEAIKAHLLADQTLKVKVKMQHQTTNGAIRCRQPSEHVGHQRKEGFAAAAAARHRSASHTFLWLFTDSQLHSNINYLSRQLQRGFGLFSPLRLAPGRPFYPKGRKAKKNTFAVVGQTSFGRLLPPSVDLSWPWLISKKCIKKRHDARLINANSLAVRKPQQLHRAEFPQRYANEDSVRLKIETLVSFFFGEKIGFIELVEHCASRNGPND